MERARLPLGALGMVLTLAGAIGCSSPPTPAGLEASCFETPSWVIYGSLRLRSEAAASDSLLLRLLIRDDDLKKALERNSAFGIHDNDPRAIYRYRPGQREIEIVGEEVWDRAAGAIGDCSKQQVLTYPSPLKIHVDSDYDLRFEDQVIPTAGKGVLFVVASPLRDVVAVLSAEIPPVRGFLFGKGGSGQHYHQFFRVQDATPVGGSIRLPPTSGQQMSKACWSPDGRYVLYSGVVVNRVCIIPGPQ